MTNNLILRITTFFVFFICIFSLLFIAKPVEASNIVWTQKSSMPTSRYSLGIAAVNNKVYTIGGSINGNPSSVVEEYNPNDDIWVTRSPMPVALQELAVVGADNGKIYVAGGWNGSIQSGLWEFNPSTDVWTMLPGMPTPRSNLGLAFVNGKLYAIGGTTSSGYSNVVEEYTIATSVWTLKANLPTPRGQLAVTAGSDGKVYAIGGRDANKLQDIVERYDPGNNTWTTLAGKIRARTGLGAAVANGGKIYAVGGEPNAGDNNIVEEYDSLNDVWTTQTSMLTPSVHLGITTAGNGKVYAFGGHANGVNAEMSFVSSNQPPVINIPSNAIVNVNNNYSIKGSFTDPDSLSWKGTVDYGDGSGVKSLTLSGKSFTLNHSYKKVKKYTIKVTIIDNQGASSSAFLAVDVVKQLTSLSPAQIWVSNESNNSKLKFDLLAEVYKDDVLISSGQVNSLSVSGSGCNLAKLQKIPFAKFSPVNFSEDSTLKLKLSVRNACQGLQANSGEVGLWFNNKSVNSRFGAKIGSEDVDYFLRDSFVLSNSISGGSRKSIDVQVGGKCGVFKSFGTWVVGLNKVVD